jgi:hypothetical protein
VAISCKREKRGASLCVLLCLWRSHLAAALHRKWRSPLHSTQQTQYINAKGKAQITGQLFLRRNDGVVVYGAGSQVSLLPATAYARERFSNIYASGKMHLGTTQIEFSDDNPDYHKLMKLAKANGEGRFAFTDVAPGSYYLTGVVTWCVPNEYGCATQGGSLMESVTVTSATDKLDVVMNGL